MLLLGVAPAAALQGETAETPETLDEQAVQLERVERILELRRELQRLLEKLPPELRTEVERRWLEALSGPTTEPVNGQNPPAAPAGEPDPIPEAPTHSTPPAGAPPAPALSPSPVPASPEASPVSEPLPSPTGGPAVPTPPAPIPPQTGAIDRRPLPSCDTLRPLDGNGDNLITGADRYWRHLHLWSDDGDGTVEKGEVERLFSHGIRALDVDLRTYKTAKGDVEDVWIDGQVRFELYRRGRRQRSGLLMLDADGLLRGDDFRLLDTAGSVLTGMQTLRPGLRLEAADGTLYPLLCG